MENKLKTQRLAFNTKHSEVGTVFWITGLSGAGKTTIGKLLYDKLRLIKKNVVFLDGDIMREIFGNGLGYSIEDRKKLSKCYSKLCKELSKQGLDVVCATISMFHDCRKRNKENISSYKEIYLKVSKSILLKRDQKQLYSKSSVKQVNSVVGVDLEIEEPRESDIVIENNGVNTPEEITSYLFESLISVENYK